MAIGDLFIPVLPIDLTGDFDSASGSAGAALISARWFTTAAVLRNALTDGEAADAAARTSGCCSPRGRGKLLRDVAEPTGTLPIDWT